MVALLFAGSFLAKGLSVYENLCRTSQQESTSLSFQSCKHQQEELHEKSCCQQPPACCSTSQSEEPSIQVLCCTSQLKNISNGLDYNQQFNKELSTNLIQTAPIVPKTIELSALNIQKDGGEIIDGPPLLSRKIYQRIACYLI